MQALLVVWILARTTSESITTRILLSFASLPAADAASRRRRTVIEPRDGRIAWATVAFRKGSAPSREASLIIMSAASISASRLHRRRSWSWGRTKCRVGGGHWRRRWLRSCSNRSRRGWISRTWSRQCWLRSRTWRSHRSRRWLLPGKTRSGS